jgi:bla regulator protein blaR1
LAGFATVLFGWWNRWRVVSVALDHAKRVTDGRELAILRRLKARYPRTRRIRALPLFMSQDRMEPGVFGAFRPVLVWPEQLSTKLDDEHIEAVIAHELAHVRRRDGLTALVHMLVEAVFWFHPLVWWMEREMVKERERACDEAVLELGGDADVYAEGLLKTCRFCIESPLVYVAGTTGADLKRRVAEIITGPTRLRVTRPKKLLIGAMAVCAVAGPVALGLIQTIPLRGQVLHADGQLPSFEVATIKPLEGAPPPMPGGPPRMPPDEVRLFVNTRILISMAYNVRGFARSEVVGGPAWLDSQIYEVHGKINGSLSEALQKMPNRKRRQEIELMEQSLLAKRFHLKVHYETRELPEYALVAAKGGPRLNPADPLLPHNGTTRVSQGQNQELKTTGSTIQNLIEMLQSEPEIGGRSIQNKTGLTGSYNFALDWTRDLTADVSGQHDGGPSLFTALEEQLGLKLVAIKGPVEVVVIDHINRPSAN